MAHERCSLLKTELIAIVTRYVALDLTTNNRSRCSGEQDIYCLDSTNLRPFDISPSVGAPDVRTSGFRFLFSEVVCNQIIFCSRLLLCLISDKLNA